MKKRKSDPNALSIYGHLRELRKRVLLCLVLAIVVFLASYVSSAKLLSFVLQTGESAGYNFVAISPQEVLLQELKVAGVLTLLLTLPFIAVQVASFVSPALGDRKAARCVVKVCLFSTLLAIIGLIFAYCVLFPVTCKYLHSISRTVNVTAQVSVEKYVSFFLTVEICMCLVFQIPLICAVLVRLGLISVEQIKQYRPVVIVVIFIVAALITPPDVVSQCIVAIPMILLYEGSIRVCMLSKRTTHMGGVHNG